MLIEIHDQQEAGMGLGSTIRETASHLGAYLGEIAKVIGHADRVAPLRDYCAGLLVAPGRRSVEPLAAVTAPANTRAQHQRLLHFVANSAWSDERVLGKVRELVEPSITRREPIVAWIVDDTGIPKKGEHSVGVHHQYCGQLGKQANCQVAVTLSIANHHASLPIAHQLYLPQEWIDDKERCKKVGVPPKTPFRTKPQLALEQIRAAMEAGVSPGVILADGGYGVGSEFRFTLMEWGLTYVVGIGPTHMVRQVRAGKREPPRVSVKELALSLTKKAWRTVTWRQGTNIKLRSRFARVLVRTAPGQGKAFAEETLLMEWPKDEAEPTKYWLANIDEKMSLRELVDLAKMRWRIERDYEELKQEVGLGHYEGRSWRGFHHHATLAIASYGFLISQRGDFSPSGARFSVELQKPSLPSGYRPRGSPDPDATSCS